MCTIQESKIFYFDSKGPINTDKTLDIALECSRERKIQNIVVASSTRETALKLHKKIPAETDIIMVTYSAGSRFETKIRALLCMPS